MRDITLEELLEAGCHFGHQVNRRNPKADEFIFEERSNIHIINLEKSREGLINAGKFLLDLSSKNGSIVVVGTKKQAKNIFYVNSRWVGGTLTNFSEVSKNFKKLKDLNEFLNSGKTSEYTKREVLLFDRERNKLKEFYGGIVDLEGVPDALVIIGT